MTTLGKGRIAVVRSSRPRAATLIGRALHDGPKTFRWHLRSPPGRLKDAFHSPPLAASSSFCLSSRRARQRLASVPRACTVAALLARGAVQRDPMAEGSLPRTRGVWLLYLTDASESGLDQVQMTRRVSFHFAAYLHSPVEQAAKAGTLTPYFRICHSTHEPSTWN